MRQPFVSVLFAASLASSPLLTAGAFAASPATDAYLANVHVNLAFLKESSLLAKDRAQSAAIKSLAEDEADNLPASENSNRVAEASDRNLPVTVSADLSSEKDGTSGDMQMGRSAYTPDRPAPPPEVGATTSAAALGYALLSSAKGEAFDSLYKATHINSLKQLADLYYSYSVAGDDTGLRVGARRDLAQAKALLDQARQAP